MEQKKIVIEILWIFLKIISFWKTKLEINKCLNVGTIFFCILKTKYSAEMFYGFAFSKGSL